MPQPQRIDMEQVQSLLASSRYRIALAKADRRTARVFIHLSNLAIQESFAALERSTRMMDRSNYFAGSR
jgi:hypothetical protein